MTLIERLRSPERATEPYQSLGDLCREAAAELEANAAEIGRLRRALEADRERWMRLADDEGGCFGTRNYAMLNADTIDAALNKQESGNV